MKLTRILITVASSLLLLVACHRSSSHPSMESFVRNYLEKYPQATLQDIYKGNFQDKFGPAHLLTDRKAVINYIQKELDSTDKLEGSYYEPCGWQGNFYQVNLSVIRDGKVTMDDFADAFMRSANGIDTTLTPSWIEEWGMIQQAVRVVSPNLEGFEEDSTRIAQMFQKGRYVMHHSRKFNALYHPHYRIIRKDLFEEKILPNL